MAQMPGMSIYGQSPAGAQPTSLPGLDLLLGPQMAQGISHLAGMFMYPGNPDPFGPQFAYGGGAANTGLAYQQRLQRRFDAAMGMMHGGQSRIDQNRIQAMLIGTGLSDQEAALEQARTIVGGGRLAAQELARLSPELAHQILPTLAPETYFRTMIAPRLNATMGGGSPEQLAAVGETMMDRLTRDGIGFDTSLTLGFGPGGFMRSYQRLAAQGMIAPLTMGPGADVDDTSIHSSITATQRVMRTLAAARTLPGMQGASTGQLQGRVQQITGGALGQVDAGAVQQDVERFREVQKATEISMEYMLKFIQGAQDMARKIGVSEVSASRSAVESLLAGQNAARATAEMFGNAMDTASVDRNAGRLAAVELRSRMSGLNSNFNRRIAATGEILQQHLGGTGGAFARLEQLAEGGNELAGALRIALEGGDLSEDQLDLLSRNDAGMVDLLVAETGMSRGQAWRLVQNPDVARRGNTRFDRSERAARQRQFKTAFRGQEGGLRRALRDIGVDQDLALEQLAGVVIAGSENHIELQRHLKNELGVEVTEDQARQVLNNDSFARLYRSDDTLRQLQLGMSSAATDRTLGEIEEASRQDRMVRQLGVESFGTRLSNLLTGDKDLTPEDAVERLGGREAVLRGITRGDPMLQDMMKDPARRDQLFAMLGLSDDEKSRIEHADDRVEELTQLSTTKLIQHVGSGAGPVGELLTSLLEAVTGQIGVGADAEKGETDNSIASNIESIEKGIAAMLEALTGGNIRLNVETGEIEGTTEPPAER